MRRALEAMSFALSRNLCVLLCAALTLLSGCQRFERHTVEDARAFYAAQNRFFRPLPPTAVPAGLVDLRASSCGVCHNEIYEEWKLSTHAHAWLDDAQFMEELKKTTAKKGRDGSWVCMNCHTPVEAQLPKLVAKLHDGDRGRPVLVANPGFDPTLQLEAITCAACHVRDGVVLGPYGDTRAPHPVRKSEELMSASLCTQCHQADEIIEELDVACTFDTGETFAAGPYPAEGKICQSCHMPEVERPLTNLKNFPIRKARRHYFGGSRIAKKPEFEAGLAPMHALYPNGARVEWIEPPAELRAGEPATLTFAVTNAEAGHSLPTGDVERFLLVKAEVIDASGAVVAERSERFGTRYQWAPEVVKLADNRLAPRESRRFDLAFEVPASGPLTLRLEGTNHRISQENFDWMKLEGRMVPSRVFFTASQELEVSAN